LHLAGEVVDDRVEQLADEVGVRGPAHDEQRHRGGAQQHERVLGRGLASLVVTYTRQKGVNREIEVRGEHVSLLSTAGYKCSDRTAPAMRGATVSSAKAGNVQP